MVPNDALSIALLTTGRTSYTKRHNVHNCGNVQRAGVHIHELSFDAIVVTAWSYPGEAPID